MKDNLVRLTENSLERSSRLLAQQHDIKVVFKGNKAGIDGNKIILPSIPDDAPSWYSTVLHGYLEKQLSWKMFSKVEEVLPQLPDPHSFACFSMVEDLRTSRKYQDIYPGAVSDASALELFNFEMLHKAWGSVSPVDKVLQSTYLCMKHGPDTLKQFHIGSNLVRRVNQVLEVLDKHIETTQDSVDAGLEIAELLRDLLEDQPKVKAPDESEKQENNQGEDSQDDSENEDSENNETKEAEDPDSELKEQLFEALNSEGGEDEGEDAFETDDTTYRVYSTEFDSIGNIEPNDKAVAVIDLGEFRASTKNKVEVIKNRLSNSLRSLTRTRKIYNQEEGDLDQDALVSLCLRTNTNVFQQYSQALKLDAAVAIAIDHSSSMGLANKIWLATQAAIVMGDSLSPLNIPFMVYGYSTHSERKMPTVGMEPYARWGNLWIRNYCNFGRPWREGALNLTQAPSNLQTHTYDGEAVLYGIRQLLARKEKRKILFVLSDGAPIPGNGNQQRCMSFLRRVVDSGTKSGIEIVGFGIQSASIQHYFPKHVILRSLDDIVGEPLKLLEKALRHGQVLK